jgi:FixJ family two-component response regulator
VLVVEDDDEVRCLLQREIQEQGHPVTAVGDAELALSALRERCFSIVITDIRMPGMDGVELTQTIKRDWPDTEVIIITGFASIDSATKAVRFGASDYLTKPFGDLNRIHESIDRALEKISERSATRLQISDLTTRCESLKIVVDQLPMGVILIDASGEILMANQGAEAILKLADGLSVNARRLHGSRPADTARLRTLLDGASGSAAQQPRRGGATTMPRPSGRADLSLLVTPLSTDRAKVTDGPATAVFVSDPEQRVETAETHLCRLYGLTPTEARVAAIVMQGKGVEEAGLELSMSTHTVRTHLKHTFAKTRTKNQGDLISLLLSGPATLGSEGD